jgi:4-hydroxy-4-methyl-2-oxoglutarate aldolase
MDDREARALLERLGRLETGQVSDVLDEAGLPHHALDGSLRPLQPGDGFVGRALCVRGEPRVAGRHAEAGLSVDAIEAAVGAGSVVVFDSGGFVAGACLGGFVAYSLQRRGCRGLVVDGALRDADEIRRLGLPTFSRAITPVNGSRRWLVREIGGSIALRGTSGVPVTIHTGDLLRADGDGIVVIPARVATMVIEDAETLAEIECRIDAEMRAGAERAAAFARNPRFDHIRKAM